MTNGTVITLKVMGQQAKPLTLTENATIANAIEQAGLSGNTYTANVNGEARDLAHVLSEGSYLVLTPAVKGANA